MTELRDTGFWHDGVVSTVRSSQDVEPILESAKALANAGSTGSPEMRLAAQIPNVVIEQYMATHGITLHEFMLNPVHGKAVLNDPALAGFRIWKGRV